MNATSTGTAVEVLHFAPESPRTDAVLDALVRAAGAAGLGCVPTRRYRGEANWLILWGPGAPNRFEPIRRQLARGGHVIAIDLAYWDRDRKVRVSIDAAHPQAWVMRRDWPTSRLQADRIVVSDGWDPQGPVVIAGIGAKATVQYGGQVAAWEAAMAAEAHRRGARVLHRPKLGASRPIEQTLRGASLVCTWHSNVAVDAIRLGIPVICQDGAAAAVCPSTWTEAPQPLAVDVRDRFLANLAWFQWDLRREAAACWAFLQALLT
jgi:hypothetical protein